MARTELPPVLVGVPRHTDRQTGRQIQTDRNTDTHRYTHKRKNAHMHAYHIHILKLILSAECMLVNVATRIPSQLLFIEGAQNLLSLQKFLGH